MASVSMPATIAYPAADSNVQVIAEPPLVCLNGRMTKEIGMKVALLQMNPTVGALRENAARILKLAHAAAEAGAEIAVFPEMALCGYSPGDLVQRARFLDDVAATMAQLGAELPAGLLTIIGAPWRKDGQVINAALLWRDGQLLAVAGKTVLDDSVEFAESQVFVPASATLVHEVKGVRVGVGIGRSTPGPGEVVLQLAAQPYRHERVAALNERASQFAQATGAPVLVANLTGSAEGLVFAGGSVAVAADGTVAARAALLREEMLLVDLTRKNGGWQPVTGAVAPLPSAVAGTYAALQMGLRDYVEKNKFPGAMVALSGGMDSALVAAIAVDALGPNRVFGVTMPSPVTANETLADALELARRLNIPCLKIPLAPAMGTLQDMLDRADLQTYWAAPLPGSTAAENVQARLRGLLAMALSNRYGHLLVCASNKSEMAVGYATLYGDMAGGLALLKDVPKTLVYELAHWRNRQGEVIPPGTIARPPSAELKANQRDTDSLPAYDELDPILERLMDRQQDVAEIVRAGFAEATVRRVARMVARAEFKRRQSAPGIWVTSPLRRRPASRPLTNGYAE